MITTKTCDLCGARHGSHGFTYSDKTRGISQPCPKMSKAEALATANTYHTAWLSIRKDNEHLYELLRLERVRARQVCHENNRLRRKLEALK